jgi:hypothetical protein
VASIHRFRWAVVGLAICLLTPSVAAASRINVVIKASPNIGTLHNELHAVAVVSSSEMFAVGEYLDDTTDRGLILQGNGSSWTASSAPFPYDSTYNSLYAVAMASPTQGWAVGSYVNPEGKMSYNLILHYSSGHWGVYGVNNATGISASALKAVALSSTKSGWAVGNHHGPGQPERPTAVHYDGVHWTDVPVQNPGYIAMKNYTATLNDVAFVPGTAGQRVWAVGAYSNGAYNQPFFDYWTGTAWKQYKLGLSVQAYLNALHTANPRRYPDTYPSPIPSWVSSVVVLSASDAWAVGDYTVPHPAPAAPSHRTFTVHWNGTSWNMVISPNVGLSTYNNYLSSVTARGTTLYAVGRYFANPHNQTLVLRWYGGRWSVVPSANSSSLPNQFEGVAVVPTGGAVSVGSYFDTHDRTLVEMCSGC